MQYCIDYLLIIILKHALSAWSCVLLCLVYFKCVRFPFICLFVQSEISSVPCIVHCSSVTVLISQYVTNLNVLLIGWGIESGPGI